MLKVCTRRVKAPCFFHRHITTDVKELGHCNSFNWCLCLFVYLFISLALSFFCQGTLQTQNQTCNKKKQTKKSHIFTHTLERIPQTPPVAGLVCKTYTPKDFPADGRTNTLMQCMHIHARTFIAPGPRPPIFHEWS